MKYSYIYINKVSDKQSQSQIHCVIQYLTMIACSVGISTLYCVCVIIYLKR